MQVKNEEIDKLFKNFMEKPTIELLKHYLEEEIVFPSSILRSTKYAGESKEKRIQKSLFKQLIDKYEKENVTTEYAVGGHWKMAIDVDMFNGTYGIELKVAEQLIKSATNVERLLGQVIYYNKRRYHGNMIVLVVGKATEYNSAIKELVEFIEELGVHFIYKAI